MSTTLRHGLYMMDRSLRSLWRQPWWIAVTLIQPVIWLLLFGALFRKVVEIPGFDGGASYIQFLAPAVLVMTAFFSSGWSGMGTIEDMDKGIMDRFLVSPVRRGALIWGRVLQSAVSILIQSIIIVGLALLDGATFPNGPGGVAVLFLMSIMLGAAFAALSNGLALLIRREESLIAAMQFLLLPLTFLSTSFMPANLIPAWMRSVADFNPVNWAVAGGREAVLGDDWGLVASRAGFLLLLLIACSAFATRAFRAYQRSV